MHAVDTNVLVRLITRDDEAQAAAAAQYVEKGAWVSTLALAEAVWVLGTNFGRTPRELARIIEMLLGNGRLVIQDASSIEDALELFRAHPSVGFSDCLHVALAKNAGHAPLGTFDRKLARLPGTERI
jgi:predicted nucleic-acid-binding protein